MTSTAPFAATLCQKPAWSAAHLTAHQNVGKRIAVGAETRWPSVVAACVDARSEAEKCHRGDYSDA